MKTFSIVYGHPESHGPQICVIYMLSKFSNKIKLLYRNTAETAWKFPINVTLIKDGAFLDQEEVYKKSKIIKAFYFLRFTYKLLISLRKEKQDIIAIFDPLALYSFNLIYKFIGYKPKIWYHNYDVIYPGTVSKYSLRGLATKSKISSFTKLDFFSLPMEERVQFFPIHLLKNKYKIIQNYSLLEIHTAEPKVIATDTVKLIFVGSIGTGHGIEEIIPLLNTKIKGKNIELILKGYIHTEYKDQILELAKVNNATTKVTILGKGPWSEVPIELRKCHIGIANYNPKKDIMNATLGKGGSGKIYQYIAEGLPVLINDAFYHYFEDEPWATCNTLTREGLLESIGYVIENYEDLSKSAINRFINDLNCNRLFDDFFNKELFNEKD